MPDRASTPQDLSDVVCRLLLGREISRGASAQTTPTAGTSPHRVGCRSWILHGQCDGSSFPIVHNAVVVRAHFSPNLFFSSISSCFPAFLFLSLVFGLALVWCDSRFCNSAIWIRIRKFCSLCTLCIFLDGCLRQSFTRLFSPIFAARFFHHGPICLTWSNHPVLCDWQLRWIWCAPDNHRSLQGIIV